MVWLRRICYASTKPKQVWFCVRLSRRFFQSGAKRNGFSQSLIGFFQSKIFRFCKNFAIK